MPRSFRSILPPCVPRQVQAGAAVRSLLPRLTLGVATAACTLAMSGCTAVSSTSAPVSQLRIIDATPDAGGIDIYAGTSVLTYNLGFGTITSYIPINPATYTLSATTSGTKSTLASTRATLLNSKQQTLLLSNVAAQLQATLLTDQSQPAPTGQIALRFLNEAISPGPLDVYLVPSGASLAKVNPIRTGLAFGDNTGYLNVPIGTYTLYLVTNGTVIATTTVPLYTGGATTYAAGSAHTVVVLDQQIVTNPAIQVVVADDYESATAPSQ